MKVRAKTTVTGVEVDEIIKAKEILETFGYVEFYSFRRITIVDWYVSVKGANGQPVDLVVSNLDDDIRYATDEDFDNCYE